MAHLTHRLPAHPFFISVEDGAYTLFCIFQVLDQYLFMGCQYLVKLKRCERYLVGQVGDPRADPKPPADLLNCRPSFPSSFSPSKCS